MRIPEETGGRRRPRYERWMSGWEATLAARDRNRMKSSFEWGLEWARHWPAAPVASPAQDLDPATYLIRLNREMIPDGDRFFGYEPPVDFSLEDGVLTFSSAVTTPYPENNVVYADWFEAPGSRRAVVLVPHWNASVGQHFALAKAIRVLGISVLRLTPPYHGYRASAGLQRAEYAVSANVCRTIDATRQAVVDIRSCCDWLQRRGYGPLGLVGISLGACYGFLAAAHDARLTVNAFSHLGTSFADIVWTGISTRHIRDGLEPAIDLEQLRAVWGLLSPVSYVGQFARTERQSLFIRTRYDTTVFPIFSEALMDAGRRQQWPHREVVLQCGHYTSGESPFKFLIGYHVCAFLNRHLRDGGRYRLDRCRVRLEG